jgi:hypothetical protein
MSVLNKILAVSMAATMVAPVAFAQDVSLSANANLNASTKAQSGQATTSGSATGTASVNATSSKPKSSDSATTTGVQNRSEVATRVQALLSVADRVGGIGVEVREIAHAYASSSAHIEEEKDDVENRPGWMVFLVGSDYKSLGEIRSELATTENGISRLTRARDAATDASVKAELDVQINALRASASTTAEFVEENEDEFSVFGWFFKFFS